jgi:SpoVK/Ycf46/Vps4 family AAA+-type ATPase
MSSLDELSTFTQRLLNSLEAELDSKNPNVRVALTMQRRRAAEECQILLDRIKGRTPVSPPDLRSEEDAFRYYCNYIREAVTLLLRQLAETNFSREYMTQIVDGALRNAPDHLFDPDKKVSTDETG